MRNCIWLIIVILAPFISYSQISMNRNDEGILITDGSKNVLFYQIKTKHKEGEYARNNYIHPLWGVDGEVITEDFPEDHLHQRGVFWAWHQIWHQNKRIGDGWELKNFIQEVAEIEFLVNQKRQGILRAEILWKSPLLKQSKPYLRENTEIKVHNLMQNVRRIDFKISLLALEEGISIGGSEDSKGYGGFSVRMKLPDGIVFESAGNKIFPENDAIQAGNTMNIFGPLGKKGNKAGLVIGSAGDNPGMPQGWIIRNKKSMQNVVFPGKEPVKLSTTIPLELHYSLLVYSGKLSDKKINKLLNY